MKKILLFVPALIIATIGTTNAQTYFSQDFEGTTGTAIPAGWAKTQPVANTTSGWMSGTALGSTYYGIPAHTRYVAVNDDITQSAGTDPNVDNSNDFLTTPVINLSASTFPVLTFDLLYYAATNPVSEVGTVELSINGGTTWTVVSTLTGSGAWQSTGASLTAAAGQSNVMIGFRYNDGGSWMYGMAVDNVVVMEAPAKEVALTGVTMPKYALAGNQTIMTTLTSHGGPTVTTAILNYSIDGGAAVPQTFSPAIGYGGSYNASFTATAFAAGVHKIKTWVSSVNGTMPADATPLDDTAHWQISILPGAAPVKNVLIEEFTGVGCGYCPQGAITMHNEVNTDSHVVWAAIHETGQGPDMMNIPDGTTVTGAYDTGDPSYALDRSFMTGPGGYNDAGVLGTALMDVTPIAPREAAVVPATVALSNVSISGQVITATVTANFVGAVEGTYALNCYVIEDRVYGPLAATTDNGWNQHSYWYANTASAYYNIGDVSSPWSTSVAGLFPTIYQHDHVVESFMGGPWGDATVIPITLVAAGANYSKTFTYTLPAANTGGAHVYNPDNISIIGMVQEYSAAGAIGNRSILNVTQQKLNTNPETGLSSTGIEELTTDFGTVSIYPNPASTSTNVALELNGNENVLINVYNNLGQLVYSSNNGVLTAGSHLVTINTENFAAGIYNITINTSKGIVSKKVIISK